MYENYKKTTSGIPLHTEEDFEGMRKAGKLASEVLDFIGQYVRVGATTEELDSLCHEFIVKANAIPAPLGYRGYPKSICTSVNHVVCHGIPSPTHKLQEGDILNIDVTVIVNGYFGDTSRMYFAGKPRILGERLSKVTYEALMLGIDQAKPGKTLRDVAKAIEAHASKHGYSCVRDFCGHGIGKIFHMEPQVMHYNEPLSKYQDMVFEPGMFFTIEPMINAGNHKVIVSKFDGWTATTKDKSLSAQWEHTIGITATGNEVFTAPR